MKVDVHFTHLERSEFLEDLAIDRITDALLGSLKNECAHAQVWLVCDHSKHHQRGSPEYSCEIEVRYPPKRECFVSKTNADLHVAVSGAVTALKSSLRADAKRGQTAKRHSRIAITAEGAIS